MGWKHVDTTGNSWRKYDVKGLMSTINTSKHGTSNSDQHIFSQGRICSQNEQHTTSSLPLQQYNERQAHLQVTVLVWISNAVDAACSPQKLIVNNRTQHTVILLQPAESLKLHQRDKSIRCLFKCHFRWLSITTETVVEKCHPPTVQLVEPTHEDGPAKLCGHLLKIIFQRTVHTKIPSNYE